MPKMLTIALLTLLVLIGAVLAPAHGGARWTDAVLTARR
jgi:hypothetical protein